MDYTMSQHTADDTEPIHTTTRVPPAESASREHRPTVNTEPDPNDKPVGVARVMPTVSGSS